MLAVLMVPISYAQEMNGTWKGILNAGNQELEIVFHFNYQENGNSTAKMDVPAQGALGIPVNLKLQASILLLTQWIKALHVPTMQEQVQKLKVFQVL